MKNNKQPATPTAPDSSSRGPTREEITQRAHLIWEQEGRPEGRDSEHWLKAEAQLQQERKQDAPQK